MALTAKRLPGDILTFALTGAGTVTAIRNLRINRRRGSYDVSAADAEFDQKVKGRRSITGSFEIWLGAEGIPPSEGDTITAVAVSVGADEVTDPDIDNATIYGKLCVTGVDGSYQDEPGTATVEWEGGYID